LFPGALDEVPLRVARAVLVPRHPRPHPDVGAHGQVATLMERALTSGTVVEEVEPLVLVLVAAVVETAVRPMGTRARQGRARARARVRAALPSPWTSLRD
jgi:hypothetical protein